MRVKLEFWCTALVAAALGVGCSERSSAAYPTHAEARAAGAFATGWLPSWLPEHAANIREVHDLDTNAVCIRFELAKDRRAAMLRPMRVLSAAEIAALEPCSLRPSWWFRELVQQAPADDGALDADLFAAAGTTPDDALIVAVDRLGTAVYVWSPSPK